MTTGFATIRLLLLLRFSGMRGEREPYRSFSQTFTRRRVFMLIRPRRLGLKEGTSYTS